MKEYVRDKRSVTPSSKNVSMVMSANRAKDTKPELILRRLLRKAGFPGYRLHWKKAPGRPDIAYPGRKLAIFVHGCYWHRCPECDLPLPKSNTKFWSDKFKRNQARDARKIQELNDVGWRTLVFWECQLKDNIQAYLSVIETEIATGTGK
jgi:DNA mismatch endonuclease (patch repair protein)